MDWLKSVFFGLVSGITELLPVSQWAHSALLVKMFGKESVSELWLLVVHLAALFALILLTAEQWRYILREQKIYNASSRRRPRPADSKAIMQLRLLKKAGLIMAISTLLTLKTVEFSRNLGIMSLLVLFNGVLLLIPSRTAKGNKDGRSISALDGVLVGLAGALGALPGISFFGTSLLAMILRGFDLVYAAGTCLLLGIPTLAGCVLTDLMRLIASGGTAFSVGVAVQCLTIFAAAFIGTVYSISAVRRHGEKGGFSRFSMYCWGFALFTFILYLTI